MYPVSGRFLQALADSHKPITQVQLFRTDGAVEELEHIGGSVSVDRGSQARRTCSVQVADPALIPRTPADRLAVYGAQLRLACGVQYSDGATELVPVGVFRIDEVSGDVDEGPVTIAGKSLEAVIADDKFTSPHRATGNAVNSITALIQRSIPSAQIVAPAGATIGARTWDIEGDPWAAILELGAAIGCEVYCDAAGTFVIAELPDLLATTPAWTVAAGQGGVYISAVRGMSLDGVYNGVHARGEDTESGMGPFSDLVVDDEVGSPTKWDGPFGRRTLFYSSSTLTTTGQCTAAATLLLRSAKAPNATADITSLPNPALEAGDVIRVVYPDGAKELHQVASFSIPLDVGGSFTIQTISAKEGT